LTLVADKQRVKAVFKEWDVLTEVLTTPIVYHPGGWEASLPEDNKRIVLEQRLEMVRNGGWDRATDAEVVSYLFTASLVQPFTSDWTNIYLYVAATLMPQIRQSIPATPTELSDYQMHELNDLKHRIRDSQKRRRISKRKEKNMSKRKLVMEENDGNVLLGVLQEGCDPIIKTKEGSIEEVLPAVPDFLKEAEQQWAVSPKNPTYKPPAKPKAAATPPAAGEEPKKTSDLPLLADTEKATPAEETTGEAAAEVAEPTAAPAEAEAETEVPPAVGPEEVPAEVAVVGEEKTGMSRMAEQEVSERIAEAPAPQPAEPTPSTAAKTGEWEYYLEDGRGPFESVQLAMDALGLDKGTRPSHNRWDRLSTALKEKIQRRPKS